MTRVFETAECEEVRNSIFWELRYEKHENQMKGCGVELRVSDMPLKYCGETGCPPTHQNKIPDISLPFQAGF